MNLPKLLPCPFCESQILAEDMPRDEDGTRKQWWIECPFCGAMSSNRTSLKEAAEAWNTRHTDPEVLRRCEDEPKKQARIEALEKALHNVVKWDEPSSANVPQVCPVCRGWNPKQQTYTKCNDACPGAIGRALLQKDGD